MKKILTILAAAAAVFAFTPTQAEAGGCQSRIHSRCGSCGGNVYAYYRPVSHCGARVVYGWVPSYHSNCGRSHSHGHSGYRGHSGVSLNFRYTTPKTYRSYPRGTTYRSYPSHRTTRSYGSRSCR